MSSPFVPELELKLSTVFAYANSIELIPNLDAYLPCLEHHPSTTYPQLLWGYPTIMFVEPHARENIAYDYAGQRRKNAFIMTPGEKSSLAPQAVLIFFRLHLLNGSKVQLGVRIANKSPVHVN